MDRSLDESIKARQRNSRTSNRDRRPPRDGIRKVLPPHHLLTQHRLGFSLGSLSYRKEDSQHLDQDWVHDRYDEDSNRKNTSRGHQPARLTKRDNLRDTDEAGTKLRVENLHWDISEDDLRELFTRIGPISSVSIVYDRQDRSTGTAYVVYPHVRDARSALQEFDGANANGQPIKLTMVPYGPAKPPRNPFDTAERPSRSLFDRVDDSERRRRAGESSDEAPIRRSNVSKPAPDHIDRYVPGQDRGGRRRSPRRNNDRGSRRPGQRRSREPKDAEGHLIVQGRPRKTAEELDAEMEDYFGKLGEGGGAAANTNADDDVNMDI